MVRSRSDHVEVLCNFATPNPRCVYHNSTVRTHLNEAGAAQLIVIWQTHDQTNTLYVYDIPGDLINKSRSVYLSVSIPRKLIPPPVPVLILQGKRVRSLHVNSGGMHPGTRRGKPPSGGVALILFDDSVRAQFGESSIRDEGQYWKVLIWKHKQLHAESVCLSLFDIATLPGYWTSQNAIRETGRIDTRFSQSGSCYCALHDDCLDITLPVEEVHENSSAPEEISMKQMGSRSNDARRPNFGSIVSVDPIKRREALARVYDMLAKLLREFQEEGASDEYVADIWPNRAWSDWGQVRKPDGWRRSGVESLGSNWNCVWKNIRNS